jgi:hypothetical protein
MHNNKNLWKKPLPYQKGGNFIHGHCIIFSVFICLIMFYKTQTWGLMAIKKM